MVLCSLWLFIAGPTPLPAQFYVTDSGIDVEGRFRLMHESEDEFYYILFRGESVTNVTMAANMALGNEPIGDLVDPDLAANWPAGFYAVLRVPQFAPFDSDGDGIDDVTEISLTFLDPLNPADAILDFDGDGRSNLEEYRTGTNLAVNDPPKITVISTTSPTDGESGVAVTRETVIRFSNPLAPNTIIDSGQLFADYGGQILPARVELSADRRKVTLFYPNTLPDGATIQVNFDGSGIIDIYGRPIDADGDGEPGGVALVRFQTLSLALFPGTLVCGRVFASELAPAGNGELSVNVPLQGVTITVDGAEETMRTVTDSNGDFRLEPAPAGRFFVHIDGRTATNNIPEGAYYPFVGKAWESVPGEEVSIGEVYLPLVAAGTLQSVSETNDTVIEFPPEVLDEHPELAGVSVTVPAGALYDDNGVRGGSVGIAPVPPDRLPGSLPEGVSPDLVISIQTDGASNFDVPVPACFPNLPDPETGERLLPGTKVALLSFNHDTGRFEVAGSMTVSADGLLVCTDPGVGILAPGWHFWDPRCWIYGGRVNLGATPAPPEKPEPTGAQPPADEDCDAAAACTNEGGEGTPVGLRVYLHSGEEVTEREDLFIPGRGDIHFSMRRSYRSQLLFNGPLGHGWTYSYNEALFVETNGNVTRVIGNSHVDVWERLPDGTYQAPRGFFGRLTKREDGTFVYRTPDGFQRFYRSDGRLFCYRDRYGNQMLFDYDTRGNLDVVIDVYGREIDFVFETFSDGKDRLARIIDFVGREIVYTYDDNFDLTEVRTPIVKRTSTANDFPNGRTERYTYSSGFDQPELNHNILSITYPEEVAQGGPPAVTWTYGEDPGDPLTFDRVLTETEGGVNASGVSAGGTTSFVYEKLNEGLPPGDPEVPRGKVTLTERNGNVYEFFANELNHHILTHRITRGFRQNEPPFYETRSYYDDDGQLVRRVFPEGNEIRYVYDSGGERSAHRNLLEVRRVADADRGGGEDLVSTFTYEPLYNQIASITGPRGNATAFSPPLGAATEQRYTKQFYYDYQESNEPVVQAEDLGIDLSGVARGLGDLNDDGRTDQTAGHLIQVREPTVTLPPDSNTAVQAGNTQQPIVTQLQWNDRGQLTATIDPEGNVNERYYHRENDPDGDGNSVLSAYLALSTQPRGYLQADVVDSRLSARRTSSVPPVELETRYTYDPVGNLTRIRNPRGVVMEIEYNSLNEPIVITRGTDVSEALASGQLRQPELPFRYQTRLTYDSNGRVVLREVENRDLTTTGVGDFVERTYTYDILDNVVQSTVEVDAATILTTRLRYDQNELPTLLTQPEGNQRLTEYDERNLPFRVTRGFGATNAATTQMDYDLNGQLVAVVDAEDNDGDGQPEVTTMVYDGFDRQIGTVDALGNQFLRDYDVAGNVVRRRVLGHPPGQSGATNVLLSDTAYLHDELNRVFQLNESLFLAQGFNPVRPVNLRDQDTNGVVTTRFEYDASSRSIFLVEDDLQVTHTLYDGANRPVEQIDALDNRLRIAYDQNSNPIRVESTEQSPEGLVPSETFVTHYVYDQLDRVVRLTDNAGQTARFAYDSRNNLVAQSDPQGPAVADPLDLFPGLINQPGNTVTWFYDGLDRRVLQVADLRVNGTGGNPLDTTHPFNPDAQINLGYVYDGNSRLVGIIDDNGNRTEFVYDALDRRVRQINADLEEFVTAYDRDDNVKETSDPNGNVIFNTFDALNRLTDVAVSRAPGVGGTTSVIYEYDGLSRMTRSVDNNGTSNTLQTCEYVYDSLSRVLEDRQNDQPISTVWSGDGKRLACIYPGGRTIQSTYDAIDRLKTVADQSGQISECFWIGPGLRTLRRNNANNSRVTFLDDTEATDIGYDSVNRIARLRHLLPDGRAFADREYGYNRASVRTFERRNEHFALTDHYQYDSAYRITRTRLDQDGLPGAQPRDLHELAYAYDGVGNRRELDRTTTSMGLVTDTHTVNAMNEYTAISGVTRVHDDNGNLIDDGTRLLTYDYKNRLIKVQDKSSGNLIANYFYLADNRRTRKVVFSDTQPNVVEKVTDFFYDGWQTVEERDGQSGLTEITYVYGGTYIDELLQMQRTADHALDAGVFYYHQNARYDVIALTDDAGAVVEEVLYDDFGNPIVSTNGAFNSADKTLMNR